MVSERPKSLSKKASFAAAVGANGNSSASFKITVVLNILVTIYIYFFIIIDVPVEVENCDSVGLAETMQYLPWSLTPSHSRSLGVSYHTLHHTLYCSADDE